MKVTCPKCKRRIRLRRGEQRKCLCGFDLNYRTFFNKRVDYDVYLVDANVFIYAGEEQGYRANACRKILGHKSKSFKIGTTQNIIDEIGEQRRSELSDEILIFSCGKLNKELLELKSNSLKQPSKADLSLLQAAICHPEVHGIISYDSDFGNIASSGVVNKRSSRELWLGTAEDFMAKKMRIFKRKV